MIGTTEWIVIGTVVVLMFGAPKVVQWARTLGTAKKEFEAATKEFKEPSKTIN